MNQTPNGAAILIPIFAAVGLIAMVGVLWVGMRQNARDTASAGRRRERQRKRDEIERHSDRAGGGATIGAQRRRTGSTVR